MLFPGRSRRRLHRRGRVWPRRLASLAILGVLALCIMSALAAWRLSRVSRSLSTATATLERVDPHLRTGDFAAVDKDLQDAEAELVKANNTLRSSPELSIGNVVPVLHQNIAAVRRSVSLALRLVDGGRRVMVAAQPLRTPDGKFVVSLRGGGIPLTTVRALVTELDNIAFDLPGPTEAGSSRWLMGRVSSLKRAVFREATHRRQQFTSAATALDLLSEVAGGNGPRRYLLAVANIAEMRGSGGMILSYGILSSRDGRFSLDRFGPIDDLKLDAPAPAQPPPDVVARLAALEPNKEWRNANLPLNFKAVGPVLESMFTKATGLSVDGVLQLDSVGLGAILRATGPVDVAGLGSVNADNVVPLTLNEAYTRFPTRPVRQEYLESVARATFDHLLTGEFSTLTPLADSLRAAVSGRHMLFHSPKLNATRAVEAFGADGSVPTTDRDWASLTVQNFGANKLDYYLDTSVRLTGSRVPGRLGNVKAEIKLSNTAPPNGKPPYVFGPFDTSYQAGEYRGLVSLYVPAGTYVKSSTGTDPAAPPIVTTDDGQTVAVFTTSVPAGESRTVMLDLLIPPGPPGPSPFELVSTPRVRPTVATVSIDEGSTVLRMDGPLAESMVLEPGRARPAAIVGR
jgi:uncharacterized protein DUF4012